jgi:hypothetical protein
MKKADAQICLKISGPLRAALESEAAAESRGLSSLVRKILVEHTTQRIVSRQTADATRERRADG